MRFFEDMQLGDRREFGAFTFKCRDVRRQRSKQVWVNINHHAILNGGVIG